MRNAGEVEALRSLLGEVLPCQTGGGVALLIGVTLIIMVVRGTKTTMAIGGLTNSERSLSDFQDKTRGGVFEDIIQDIVCPTYKSQGLTRSFCSKL